MKKVLLINPDSDTLTWYKYITDRDDLHIFTAATAEEGLRIHHKEKVDLLISARALNVFNLTNFLPGANTNSST